MPQAIKQLYDSFYRRPSTAPEQERISQHSAQLKHNFNKHQRKLFLRIIDDKDLICDIVSQDSFEQGFRLGMKLATETYQTRSGVLDEDNLSDMPLLSCQEEER